MLLLAIESSGKPCSVALFRDGVFVDQTISLPDEKTVSEKILLLIDALLQRHGVSLSASDSVAVGAGPGSFTSLRVALATAMGLTTGLKAGIIPVSNLKALAHQMKDKAPIIAPVVKSGRGRMYGGAFEVKENRLSAVIAEATWKPDDFFDQLKSFPNAFVAGSGVEFMPSGTYVSDASLFPTAKAIGELSLLEKLPEVSSHEIRLSYLQEPDFGSGVSSG